MLESQQGPGQNQDVEEINFDDYLITDHRDAPAGARALLCTYGGYKYYKEYRQNYNNLVKVVEECFRKKEISREAALACLEECREF